MILFAMYFFKAKKRIFIPLKIKHNIKAYLLFLVSQKILIVLLFFLLYGFLFKFCFFSMLSFTLTEYNNIVVCFIKFK